MKNKIYKRMLAGLMAVTLLPLISACGKKEQTDTTVVCPCNCENCICNIATQNGTDVAVEDAQQVLGFATNATDENESEIKTEYEIESSTAIDAASQEIESEQTSLETENAETTETQAEQEIKNEIQSLTAEQIQEREAQLEALKQAREVVYKKPNSKAKTEEINLYDKQILDNNTFDFSTKTVVFIGDSITEGVTATIDQNGNRVSYVTYANSYLKFANVLNHGKGGRMFSNYGGEELSLNYNFSNIINNSADVIVVFAGVNDYLAGGEKRYGDIYNKESDAGYCGAVRSFMKQLKLYFSNKEIFFVTTYNVSKQSYATYTDVDTSLDLNDFMQVQRNLAKEYGFHVIDIYSTGFMDGTVKENSDAYLADGLHPDDTGNIVLGEHIAAELALYFSQTY